MTDEKKPGAQRDPSTGEPRDRTTEEAENTAVVRAGEAAPVESVGQRTGMFGVKGSGDTSGYGGLVRPTVYPGPAQRPFGPSTAPGGTGWFDTVADGLDGLIEKVVIHRGEITFHIHRDNLVTAMQRLRDDETLRFEFSAGVSGVHYPDDTGRELHAVYSLLSMTWNRRIRVETTCPDADPHLPSTVAIYPTHDWHEREAWDFFGVIFDGHPALTRIQMPDDWPGHPQRKDYPLGGIPVEYKGATVPPPDQRRSYN